MEVGVMLPRVGLGPRTLVESAERLERLGFHSAWLTDAINRGFASPDPIVALAAVATRTTVLRLGTAILQLGIREPVELANRVMTAHLIAGRRLSLGVGAGSTRADFEALGIPYEQRFARFDHAIGTMRRLWCGESVNGVNLAPFESTVGGPPVLIGSWRAVRWITRAASEFDGWIASGRHASWDDLEIGIGQFRRAGGLRAVVANVVVEPASDQTPGSSGPSPSSTASLPDTLGRLRALGFDEVVLRVAGHSDELIGRLAEIAEVSPR